MVEIANLSVDVEEMLIMDEPTSALTEKKIDKLFRKLIIASKRKGVCIVYISHRKVETYFVITSRFSVTALCFNHRFHEITMDESSPKWLAVRWITIFSTKTTDLSKKDIILSVMNAEAVTSFKPLNFDLRQWNLGITSGRVKRTELARAIFGGDPLGSVAKSLYITKSDD